MNSLTSYFPIKKISIGIGIISFVIGGILLLGRDKPLPHIETKTLPFQMPNLMIPDKGYKPEALYRKQTENNIYEITLCFPDENRPDILDDVYDHRRMLWYHRKKDIETFRVNIENGVITQFDFTGTYGGTNTFSSTTNLHNNAIIPYTGGPLYICTRNNMFSLQNNNRNLSHISVDTNTLPSFELSRKELNNYFNN